MKSGMFCKHYSQIVWMQGCVMQVRVCMLRINRNKHYNHSLEENEQRPLISILFIEVSDKRYNLLHPSDLCLLFVIRCDLRFLDGVTHLCYGWKCLTILPPSCIHRCMTFNQRHKSKIPTEIKPPFSKMIVTW